RDASPWGEAVTVVGLRLQGDSVPRLGIGAAPQGDGTVRVTRVVANGAAAGAGVAEGDVIVSVNGQSAVGVFVGNALRRMYAGKPAGTPIPVAIKRGEQALTIQVPLRYGAAAPRIVEDAAASPRAVRLRDGLLHGTTTTR